MEKRTDVSLDRTFADKLVSDEVGIMGRRDVVLREWASHVVIDPTVLVGECGVVS